MHWLWVVLIRLVVGALAKIIMPGKDPGGFIVTILLRHCGVDRRNLARSGDWMVSGGTVGRTNHVSGGSSAAPRHLSRGAKTFSLIAVLHSRVNATCEPKPAHG